MISQQPAGLYSVVLNPAETRDEASNPVFNPCRFSAGVVFFVLYSIIFLLEVNPWHISFLHPNP